jgi:hypothetical protein
VQHRHDGVGAGHRRVQLVRLERAVVGRDPELGARRLERHDRRLRQAAGDDDARHDGGA